MLAISAAILAVLAFAAAPAGAAERMHYLELVNRTHESVTALAIAPAGDASFRAVPMRAALRGGGGSTTVGVAGDRCRYDLRLHLRDGRAVIYRDFDVCRNGRLRIARLPRAGEALASK